MRAEPPPRRGDEGFSLVELLVAMAVLSIVMVMVTNLFVTVTRATQSANVSRNAVGQASNAMDEITRTVRLASPNAVAGTTPSPAVASGTSSTITVLTYVDTAAGSPMPTQVAFALNSGALQETRTASNPSGTFAVFTGAATTRTVASGLTSIAFGYADASGTAITPSGTGLTAAQQAQVATVTVTVTAPSISGGTSDPIVLTSTVLLTNVALAAASAS